MRSGLRPMDDHTEYAMDLDLYEGETLCPPAAAEKERGKSKEERVSGGNGQEDARRW